MQRPNTTVTPLSAQLERFEMDYDLGAASREVKQAIEQTQVNIQWVSENKDIVLDWFQSQT